jgi:hypothetical protein
MATLGRREMTRKVHHDPPKVPDVGIAIQVANLSVIPSKIQPLTTFGIQPIFFGSPIMREDFITTTGFMSSRRT